MQLIAKLTATISGMLDPLIPRGGPIALLDFPQAPNVGDSLIWLGELAYLQQSGRGNPCYFCTSLTYDRAALARRVGNGTILLSGGGNFGDLYPTHHGLREQVIADFPDNRIIQLPQSIHFDSAALVEQAARVLDRHQDLTLLLRDRSSLEFARQHFRAPSMLCPDMAFCLGPLSRPSPAKQDVLWLSRADKESPAGSPVRPPDGLKPVDWVDDDTLLMVRVNRLLTRTIRFRPVLRPSLLPLLGPTYAPLLRHRLERGVRTLSAGRVVATNRLHAYILSLLLGIPHFLADNHYGKVRGFHEAWTRDSLITHACDSEGQALQQALEFADRAQDL
ncbi:MAG: polysaccharide pyruvyl transferase family protein [Candidatus Eisenbacteria bacterium]